MDHDLYFLPILVEALRQENQSQSLCTAIARIRELGAKPEYEAGFKQFRSFMTETRDHFEWLDQYVREELIVELAAGSFDGRPRTAELALSLVRLRPTWKETYAALRSELDHHPEPRSPTVSVRRDGDPFIELPLDEIPKKVRLLPIVPGRYTIELDSGRILWEGNITKADVEWELAHPGKPIPVAAATGEGQHRHVREEVSPNGACRVRIYAGLRSGQMEVDILTMEP
ncbi:MAG TPA: hypothetical protein PK093_05650 [Phycisphaerae bacterium]|nr:hypothetical protein [Phycisphaerae bacterium]